MKKWYKKLKRKHITSILTIVTIVILITIGLIINNPIPTIIGIGITCGTIITIIIFLIYKNKNTQNIDTQSKQNTSQTKKPTDNDITYTAKQHYLSSTEQNFYNTIRNITEEQYITLPQVPLSQIVEKQSNYKYQNELYRVVDICIFEKKTYKPLLCIEINDETHHQKNRYMRDLKVKEILRQAGIPLIILWTEYGVNVEYIKKRINEHIRLY